jgi:hypothetical protein
MRRPVVVLIALVVLLAAAAGVLLMKPGVLNDLRPKQAVTDEKTVNEMVTVFVRNPYKDDYGMLRLPGHVDNLTASDIASVRLEVTLYEDGERREVVEYVVNDVPAKKRRTFDANAGAIPGMRTAKVQVKAIEVYR